MPPAAAQVILGKFGGILIVIIVLMAITYACPSVAQNLLVPEQQGALSLFFGGYHVSIPRPLTEFYWGTGPLDLPRWFHSRRWCACFLFAAHHAALRFLAECLHPEMADKAMLLKGDSILQVTYGEARERGR